MSGLIPSSITDAAVSVSPLQRNSFPVRQFLQGMLKTLGYQPLVGKNPSVPAEQWQKAIRVGLILKINCAHSIILMEMRNVVDPVRLTLRQFVRHDSQRR